MKYYKRGFLNMNEGMAAFIAAVEYSELRGGETHNGAIDAGLTISDCGRQINLDFYIYDEAEYINAIHKLTVLQDELAAFRVQLDVAYAAWKEGDEQARVNREGKVSTC